MKKCIRTLLSLCLVLIVMCTVVPVEAQAAVGSLSFGANNASGDGYTWDAASRTLTLNGLSVSTRDDCGIYIGGSNPATIVLNGTNTVTVDHDEDVYAVYSKSSLTIKGTGSLNVNIVGGENDYSCGIHVDGSLAITESASVAVNICNNEGTENNICAICVKNDITINTNGTVNVNTEEAEYESFGIHSRSGNVAITGTNTTVNYGGAERHSARGIYANEGNGTVSISGANVSVTSTGKADNENNAVYGNLTISNGSVVNLKSGDSDDYNKYSHAVSGNVTISNSTVTLDSTASGVKIASGAVTIDGYPYNYMTQTTSGGNWTVGDYNPKNTSYLHVESAKRYIKLHGEGGKTEAGETEKTTYFAYGATSVDATNPFTRDGYTFDGWTWKADGKEMEGILESKSYAGPHYSSYDLYAVWKPITYTITYSGNGGIVPEGTVSPDKITLNQDGTYTQKFTIEDTFNMVNLFTKEGHQFVEWQYRAAGTNEWYDSLTETNQLSNLTGNWEVQAVWKLQEYTLTFNGDGGKTADSKETYSVTYDVTTRKDTSLTNNFSKAGYTFDGWLYKAAGDKDYSTDTIPQNYSLENNKITGDFDFKAKWTANTYTVAFDPNGGSGDAMEAMSFTYDESQNLITNTYTAPTGYSGFAGWNTAADGSGTSYADGASVSNLTTTDKDTVTLYAQWKPNTYTVKFNGNGNDATNTAMADQSFDYGETKALTKNTYTKAGYSFAGWKNGETTYTDEQSVSNLTAENGGVVTLTAQWTLDKYTIIYSGNGGIVPEGTVSPDKITLNQDGTYTQKFTIEDTFKMVNLFTKEGYHFNEWSCSANADKGNTDLWTGDLGEQTELSELTGHWKAEATWTPNTYTVKFDANGGRGEMEDQTFTYDEAAKALTQNRFTKSQKVFAGWSTDKDAVESEYEDGEAVRNLTTANNGTVTLYAVWGNKESNVTLDPNGGTIADGKKFDKYFEGVVKDLPTKEDMSREHYEFDGWYDSTDETKTTITQIPANAEGKKTYIAKWSAINYTLKFDGNGGKTKEGVTGITGGESAYRTTYTVETQPESLPNHFEKAGYTFEKWYWQYDNEENLGYQDDRVVGVDYSLKDQNITGNFKLKAKWTANTYTVKFDANGGSGEMEDQLFTYDETKSLTANTFNNGDKIFVNWNTQADGKGITYTDEEVVKNLVTSGEITLYAMWGDGEFNVKLDPAGGTIDPDANFTTYIAGVAKNLPTADAVTKEHYTFAGWYDKADATKATVTQIPASATGDKEYIAKWTPNTYKVTLDPNGGTVNSGNVTDYDFGETTKLPTDVTKPGCTFAGWYDEDGNKVSEIPADSTGDRKFTARWTPNTYKVTLDPNGGTINSGNVTDYDFGETIKLPTNVTKPGCTFAGWYDEDGNKVSEIPADSIGDRKFTAKWYLAADDTSPVTGDTSSIQFWTILLVTSLAAIVVLIVFSNKKRSNRV